jgi:spore coat polysaccharide biosynthesis protein SpsF
MIVAILQARMTSTRLPGKVLAPVLGRPMLGRQVERLERSQRLDRIILATTDEAIDDPVADYALELGLGLARGSRDDVLSRFLLALDQVPEATALVRLTADCPLADWRVIDAVIDQHLNTGADYTRNTLVRTFPHGLDAEVMKPEVLRRAGAEATTRHEREHVTPYIYETPGRFRLASVERKPSLAHLRWTVDYPEDLDFVRQVYETLYPADNDFTTDDIAALDWNSSRAAG